MGAPRIQVAIPLKPQLNKLIKSEDLRCFWAAHAGWKDKQGPRMKVLVRRQHLQMYMHLILLSSTVLASEQWEAKLPILSHLQSCPQSFVMPFWPYYNGQAMSKRLSLKLANFHSREAWASLVRRVVRTPLWSGVRECQLTKEERFSSECFTLQGLTRTTCLRHGLNSLPDSVRKQRQAVLASQLVSPLTLVDTVAHCHPF